MDLYKLPHKYYCEVDLHSRTMYLCVVGQEGRVLLHRSLPCDPTRFLLAVAPFRYSHRLERGRTTDVSLLDSRGPDRCSAASCTEQLSSRKSGQIAIERA
jgi:hypothetical protein